jgi:hypothetical protein
MPTAVSQSDLVVWAEPTILENAKHLFSPLDADFHATPRTGTIKDLDGISSFGNAAKVPGEPRPKPSGPSYLLRPMKLLA